jgi:hypothetical protein
VAVLVSDAVGASIYHQNPTSAAPLLLQKAFHRVVLPGCTVSAALIKLAACFPQDAADPGAAANAAVPPHAAGF